MVAGGALGHVSWETMPLLAAVQRFCSGTQIPISNGGRSIGRQSGVFAQFRIFIQQTTTRGNLAICGVENGPLQQHQLNVELQTIHRSVETAKSHILFWNNGEVGAFSVIS